MVLTKVQKRYPLGATSGSESFVADQRLCVICCAVRCRCTCGAGIAHGSSIISLNARAGVPLLLANDNDCQALRRKDYSTVVAEPKKMLAGGKVDRNQKMVLTIPGFAALE